MDETPFQRDYLQITGVLTAGGALLFGLLFAGVHAKSGVMPTDRRSLILFGVLVALIIGGAGLARLRWGGGIVLAVTYAGISLWCLRLAALGLHAMSTTWLASTFAAAALLLLPGVFVVRWRRFLR